MAENLAGIPEDWSVDDVTSFMDYAVERTSGKGSIRLPPSGRRECDGHWYTVKPGDHVVAKVWIHVDSLAGYTHNPGDPWSWKGGRLGVDLNGGGYCLFSYPLGDNSFPYGAPNTYVEWGTPGWVQKTYDFIVPADYFTKDLFTGNTVSPTQISSLAIWVQAIQYDDAADAWFADAELYVNPGPELTWCCPCDGFCFETLAELNVHKLTHTCAEGEVWNWVTCRCEVKPVVHGGCFIASACGTNNKSLDVLRSFRDKCMPRHLILLYYLLSPGLASLISTHTHVKTVGRRFWNWLAVLLKKSLSL